MEKLYQNKEWLNDQYWNENKSTNEIAKECNKSQGCIQWWMVKLNIPRRTISDGMKNKQKGSKHPNWKGGKPSIYKGYRYIYEPSHPKAHKNRVPEHILIAEKMLGRYLIKGEHVHHINFDGLDNRSENLHVFSSNSKHQKVKASLFKIIPSLVNKNVIKFDRKKGEYYN